MREFRERAYSLLDGLEAAVGPHPDLKEALDSAREELSKDDPLSRRASPDARSDAGDLAEHS